MSMLCSTYRKKRCETRWRKEKKYKCTSHKDLKENIYFLYIYDVDVPKLYIGLCIEETTITLQNIN